MAEHVYLLSMLFIFGTIIIVFGFKYGSAAYQARARIASDAAYRDLAQSAVATQAQTATALADMQAELTRINTKLAAVTKILEDVQ
ncbi:MAG: hypothetical protein ABL931_09965 [Usitatibacteraceae bacterium]